MYLLLVIFVVCSFISGLAIGYSLVESTEFISVDKSKADEATDYRTCTHKFKHLKTTTYFNYYRCSDCGMVKRVEY